jgi:hypothetical protein
LWWLKKQVPSFFKNKFIFNLFFIRNRNLVKLIYITQKHKKLTQNLKLTWNPKSYWAYIYFRDTFNSKNILSQFFLNSPYHIKLFDIKFNRFDECNYYSDHFLSILESDNYFSLLSKKKKLKMRKMKFNIKINFFKNKKINYRIVQNYRELKWAFITNFKSIIYYTFFFYLSLLSFNSTVFYRKIYNCVDLN